MSIELATKYSSKVDEVFTTESKTALVTNQDFDWTGAHTVKVYSVSTADMYDYTRSIDETKEEPILSRFGNITDLSASTQEMVLSKDRSFIFNVDKLDQDETGQVIEANKCLNRQIREVVIPERDKYIYKKMFDNSGFSVEVDLTTDKLYKAIIDATTAMDEAEVPDLDRVLVLTPKSYASLKTELQQVSYNDMDAQSRMVGVIGMLDGMPVIKVPSSLLPEKVVFMIAQKSATVAPVKLEDFGIHQDTPLSSGSIVTGRVCYDAFVLDNKKKGIYVATEKAKA